MYVRCVSANTQGSGRIGSYNAIRERRARDAARITVLRSYSRGLLGTGELVSVDDEGVESTLWTKNGSAQPAGSIWDETNAANVRARLLSFSVLFLFLFLVLFKVAAVSLCDPRPSKYSPDALFARWWIRQTGKEAPGLTITSRLLRRQSRAHIAEGCCQAVKRARFGLWPHQL